MSGLFGSKPSGNTTTTQEPWSGVQPYLKDLFARGHIASNTNNTLPGQSPETLQAQGLLANRATQGSPLVNAAQQTNLATSRGDFLNLANNPAAQSAMNMAKSKINSQFQGNNYGNSTHQEWLGRGLMDAAAPFYAQERNLQQQATGMAPGLAAQDYTDIGMLGQVGAQKDARAEREANYPWEYLQKYQGILGSGSGQGGSTSNPYFTNPAANALGLGLGGMALYNGLGLGGAAAGGAAASSLAPLAGMGGEALALLFSDERVKENVERIGTHDTGVGLYKYNYVGDKKPQVGVMAQEFMKVKPEAVYNVGGLLAVDYNEV